LVPNEHSDVVGRLRLDYKNFAESSTGLLIEHQENTMAQMTPMYTANSNSDCAVTIALDWADEKHAVALQVNGDSRVERSELRNTPEAIEEWAQNLAQRFPGCLMAVAIEQSRGAVVATLAKYTHLVIFPVHPNTLANYRKSFCPSGAKSDPGDTELLLDLVQKHPDRFQPLKTDTVETRTLQFLTEQRRKLVEDRVAYSLRLTAWLKQIFPQVLAWFQDVCSPAVEQFLLRFPTLEVLQRARRATLREFFQKRHGRSEEDFEQRWKDIREAVPITTDRALIEAGTAAVQHLVKMISLLRDSIASLAKRIEQLYCSHPDYFIFDSLPGAGSALGPRLLAALGTDRNRFSSASELQCWSGIAPVLESSGKQKRVRFRQACPKFIRQSVHEWAVRSLPHCDWARTFYQDKRSRRVSHHAAIRALAFKWLRILFRCWKNRVPYDEKFYLAALAKRRSHTLCTNSAI
jgi:Transposase/Transposase IS116/IS110/IS902 family